MTSIHWEQINNRAEKAITQTSVTGKNPLGNAGGFTLLELLVVIMIMGVLSALAAYSIQDNQSQRILKSEASRLYAVLQATGDDAAIYDDTLGVDISGNTCRLMRYDDRNGWQVVKEDGDMREYTIPQRIQVTVDRDKNQSRAVVSAVHKTQPAAVFYSSGDNSPFRITLQLKDATLPRYVISFNKDNVMILEEQQHE